MKKLILSLGMIFTSLLFLASCGETEAKIKLPNADGEFDEVTITATEDETVIQQVLDYTSNVEYEEFTGIKATSTNRFEMEIEESGYSTNMVLDASASMIADVTQGLSGDAEVNFTMSGTASGKLQANVKAGVVANISLMELLGGRDLSSEYLYLDVESKISSGFQVETDKEKIKLNLGELVHLIMENIPELPELPDFDEDSNVGLNVDTIADFKKEFPNSKLSISHASDSEIKLKLSFGIVDILSKSEDVADIPADVLEALKDEILFDVEIVFATQTGYFIGYDFTFDNLDLLNTMMSLGESSLKKFEIKSSLRLEYGSFTVKTLTDEEKKLYIEESLDDSSSTPNYPGIIL